jgi:hypothetical protein
MVLKRFTKKQKTQKSEERRGKFFQKNKKGVELDLEDSAKVRWQVE